ncbi:hypothetical protein SLEP1_g47850 [Rubroshorea leprosula]|uniref:MULE transposase domain-containing protein n=1 Tax=Rubroshorea leprosula TaxID=152421 RepID=A0AAV5LUR4_9ROSI|nr:hypothetical protein SLEP1_g47850 [Rubroshorea leprosula]
MDNKANCIRVKTYKREHGCFRTSKISAMTMHELAKYWKRRIRETPFIACKFMMEQTYAELRVAVHFDKCVRAKRMIMKELRGNFKDEYAMLPSYGAYLSSLNPSNTIEIVKDRNENGECVFKRIYVCLGVVKEGWKNGCRYVLGVDGYFLKGVCKGVLLSAVGRDGNNQMYPMAWAIVQGENMDSWEWFFWLLRTDLNLDSGKNFTLISDEHVGIKHARDAVLPDSEHRNLEREYGETKGNFK